MMPDAVQGEFAVGTALPRAMVKSRLRRFFTSGGATPYLLILPSLLIVLFVVAIPLVVSLWSSFTPYNLVRPWTLHHFIGLRNYERLFGDSDFWWALGRTVVFLTLGLNLEMLLGLGLALLVNKITAGKRIIRTIMMFPMMFSPILVGFQFKYIFNDNVGLINNALSSLGLEHYPIAWLVNQFLAPLTVLAAEIWMSTSVFAILLLAGLLALPSEPLEAAKVDGCNAWQAFRHITLPFLMPFIYHRHDHPLAGRGARLRHGEDHDGWRPGAAHRTAVDPHCAYGIRGCADGDGECDGLRFHPLVDRSHRLFLS